MSVGRAPPQIRDRIVGLRRVRADTLLPNPKNWRRHPKAQGEALEGLLQEIGYADALLARETPDGLMLIDGHLRAETTPKTKVPVLVLDLDEAEADKLLLTLDPLAAMAEMDGAATQALLEGVQTESDGVRAMLAGLQDEAQRLLGPEEGLTDPDAVPEDVEPIAKRGDVWACGDHRVMCGDSTDKGDVARLMAGETARLMVTDPPYGVDYHPEWREAIAEARGVKASHKVGKVTNDNRSDWRDAWALFPGEIAYVWQASLHLALVAEGLEATGFDLRSLIIWNKQIITFSRGHYHWQHEPCWYAVRKGATARWVGDRKQSTVWNIATLHVHGGGPEAGQQTQHSTQKPIECMERPMRNHDAPEVYDPFLGSGTTMIAAERLGRRCYGMEIEPRYVDDAVRRWEDYTGRKAELLHKTEAVSA